MLSQTIKRAAKSVSQQATVRKCRLCQPPGRVQHIETIYKPDAGSSELEALAYDLCICVTCLKKVGRAVTLAQTSP